MQSSRSQLCVFMSVCLCFSFPIAPSQVQQLSHAGCGTLQNQTASSFHSHRLCCSRHDVFPNAWKGDTQVKGDLLDMRAELSENRFGCASAHHSQPPSIFHAWRTPPFHCLWFPVSDLTATSLWWECQAPQYLHIGCGPGPTSAALYRQLPSWRLSPSHPCVCLFVYLRVIC
jgi:hypothetical protein